MLYTEITAQCEPPFKPRFRIPFTCINCLCCTEGPQRSVNHPLNRALEFLLRVEIACIVQRGPCWVSGSNQQLRVGADEPDDKRDRAIERH